MVEPPTTKTPDILITKKVIAPGMKLGCSFISPMGRDSTGHDFYWSDLPIDGVVRCWIRPDDFRRIPHDLENKSYDGCIETDGGEWCSVRSMREVIDDLVSRKLTPYINIDPAFDLGNSEIYEYCRDIGEWAKGVWGDAVKSWWFAYGNEPGVRGIGAEDYSNKLRWAIDGFNAALDHRAKVAACDKQSDSIIGSSTIKRVLDDHGEVLSAISIHGLYNEGQGEEDQRLEAEWVREQAAQRGLDLEVLNTEWAMRKEDMDTLPHALSTSAAYIQQALGGITQSLYFWLFCSTWSETGPGWGWNVYGLVHVDNRTNHPTEPTRSYRAIGMTHEALNGPIVEVKGPDDDGVLIAGRRDDEGVGLAIVNRSGEDKTYTVGLNMAGKWFHRAQSPEYPRSKTYTHGEVETREHITVNCPDDSLVTVALEKE